MAPHLNQMLHGRLGGEYGCNAASGSGRPGAFSKR